jgi:hypothetical protein
MLCIVSNPKKSCDLLYFLDYGLHNLIDRRTTYVSIISRQISCKNFEFSFIKSNVHGERTVDNERHKQIIGQGFL